MFSVTEHEHKENDADDVKYVVEVEFNLDMAWSCVQISKLLFTANTRYPDR